MVFLINFYRGRLIKHFGNHDYNLSLKKKNINQINIHESLKLVYKKNSILIFHGHQANRLGKIFFLISSIVLRIIANPLRIKNYSVAYNSRRKYAVEKRVYNFHDPMIKEIYNEAEDKVKIKIKEYDSEHTSF